MPPSGKDISRFLVVFDVLEGFSAQQAVIRGMGAFDPTTTLMPDPSVIRVLAWLKDLAG
jgi:hypothetical protein